MAVVTSTQLEGPPFATDQSMQAFGLLQIPKTAFTPDISSCDTEASTKSAGWAVGASCNTSSPCVAGPRYSTSTSRHFPGAEVLLSGDDGAMGRQARRPVEDADHLVTVRHAERDNARNPHAETGEPRQVRGQRQLFLPIGDN